MRYYIVTEEDLRILQIDFNHTSEELDRLAQIFNREGMEEIVRCGDCDWFCEGRAEYLTASSCRLLGIINDRDFFCAVGIRKEDA